MMVGRRRKAERRDLLGCGIAAMASCTRGDLADELRLDLGIADTFHHGEMLEVVVGLKQGVSGKEFHQYTTDTPNITWIAPSKSNDNFWCAIMPGGDHRRVVFVIERGRAEVDQTDFRVEEDLSMSSLAADGRGGGGDGTIIGKGLIAVLHQKDILWLQIGVDQIEVMEDCDMGQQISLVVKIVAWTHMQRW